MAQHEAGLLRVVGIVLLPVFSNISSFTCRSAAQHGAGYSYRESGVSRYSQANAGRHPAEGSVTHKTLQPKPPAA